MQSLGTFRQLLAERRARRTMVEVPTTAITIDKEGYLVVEGKIFELGKDAQKTLARRAGIPVDFFEPLQPRIKNYLFVHLYTASVADAIRKGHLFRNTGLVLEDGTRCVRIVDPRLVCLSGDDVLRTALAEKPQCVDEAQLEVPHFRLNGGISVSITSRTLQAKPRTGDVINAGIDILHSDHGGFATQIESYLYRLVCSNGMLVKICRHTDVLPMRLRRAAAANPGLTLRRVQEMARAAWTELDAKLEAMQLLTEDRQDNCAAIIRAIGEKLGFPKRLIEDIVRALGEDEHGRSGTLWDILGAISRVGTHSDRLSPTTRRFLQELSGDLLAERIDRCPTCGRLGLGRVRLLPRR